MRVLIYGKEGAVGFMNENNELDSTHYPENNIAHMSRNSARYNGIFSISATGVDNGKGGGWEKMVGSHGGMYTVTYYIYHAFIKFTTTSLCSETLWTNLPLFASIKYDRRIASLYYGQIQ